jgi:hypothetical protein
VIFFKGFRPKFLNQFLDKQVQIVLIIFLLIGIRDFDDYGVSTDEKQQRLIGFVNLKYILNVLFPGRTWLRLNDVPELSSFGDSIFGPTFELFLVVVELILKPADSKSIFELRHLLTHLFFLSAVYTFAMTMKLLFRNHLITFLSIMLFVCNPRIYSESFYNSKDVILMSFFMITISLFARWSYNANLQNLILLGVGVGATTSIRISGVIWVPLVIFFLITSSFNDNLKLTDKIRDICYFLFSIGSTLVVLFPYLWSNPLKNFAIALFKFANYPSNLDMLYEGEVINSDQLPTDYFFKWFFITTPLFISTLLIISVPIVAISVIVHFRQVSFEKFFRLMLISLAVPGISLIGILAMKSSIYNGWRHLYYIYPFLMLIILIGVNFALQRIHLTLRFVSIFFLLIAIFGSINWQQRYSPLSSLYFNQLASKETEKSFDIDYWGIANEILIRKILSDSIGENVMLYNLNNTPIMSSLDMLNSKERSRVSFVSQATLANYLVETFQVDRKEAFDPIPKNAKLWYELKIEEYVVARIYKL